MAFDWLGFFDSYGVNYVTKGANVARNHVSVHCPFCGAEDPSQHMSVNLANKGWRCYRNDEHRGKNPARLVQGLLGIGKYEADRLVGNAVFIPEDFMGAVMGALNPKPVEQVRARLKLPAEFRPLDPRALTSHRFVRYLEGRGYTREQVAGMYSRHGLLYATSGPMKGRVIFPVEQDGLLVSWTGRTIYPDVELRYRTLSTDPELEKHPALGPISDFLLWDDDIADGGDTLVLCEGPFDALKVRTLGRGRGIYATCCFTAQPSAAQVERLYDVAPRYRRRLLLLDRGTLGTALKVSGQLAGLRMTPRAVPERFKDPGDLRTEGDLLDALSG